MDVAAVRQLGIIDKMGQQNKKDSKKVRQLISQAFESKPPKPKRK